MPIILAVDDDRGVLQLISESLREEGIEVVTAGSVQAAIDQAARARFDAVVLDAYGDEGIPGHFLTPKFFDLVKSRLAVRGALFTSASPLRPASLNASAKVPLPSVVVNLAVCAATTPFLALIAILKEFEPTFAVPFALSVKLADTRAAATRTAGSNSRDIVAS